MGFHLVIGYGPAGAAVAHELAASGRDVRVVTRTPRQLPSPLTHLPLDAADPAALTRAAQGAEVIYQCAAPPYHRWIRDLPALADAANAAAQDSGAVLVLLGNLYGYGPAADPITERTPAAATGPKGRLRAALWQRARDLHRAGRVRAVEVRAADFFGPGVTTGGHLAGTVVPRLLGGRSVQFIGDPDAPHSWTYVPDVARAMVRVSGEPNAWGEAWHVPTAAPASARQMVTLLARAAAVPEVDVRRIPPAVFWAAGLVSPLLRELREVRYQFDRPFIVDSSAFRERFREQPTPPATQAESTVEWWRRRTAGK